MIFTICLICILLHCGCFANFYNNFASKGWVKWRIWLQISLEILSNLSWNWVFLQAVFLFLKTNVSFQFSRRKFANKYFCFNSNPALTTTLYPCCWLNVLILYYHIGVTTLWSIRNNITVGRKSSIWNVMHFTWCSLCQIKVKYCAAKTLNADHLAWDIIQYRVN